MRNAALLLPVLVSAPGCFDVLYGPAHDLERERVTRESHTPIFPVAGGAHSGMDCNECHGAFDTFTRYTCISCKDHEPAVTDPIHQGNAEYVYSETSCYECHPTGEGMSRAQHQSLFPIASGEHRDVQCSECHPTHRSEFTCIDCHEHRCSEMNDKHDEEPGYACESQLCLDCHPRGVAEDD